MMAPGDMEMFGPCRLSTKKSRELNFIQQEFLGAQTWKAVSQVTLR